MERASTRVDRPKSRSIAIAIDDLRTVYNHRQPPFEHECLHEPRLENMTALADELVSSKITLLPASGPHLGSERHANNNARTPPCEDGVDPFATTVSAANDETTVDEYDG